MHFLVGLGNPGTKYKLTRHNIGFLLLEYLAEKFNIPFSAGKGDYYFGQGNMDGNPVMLVKPTTYMNNSGVCIKKAIQYFGVPLSNIIIIYDDIDLDLGAIRVRAKGGAGTHNGIKSVIQNLQTENFARIRLGIGKHEELNLSDFVLSHFANNEKNKVQDMISDARDASLSWITEGADAVMKKYNKKNVE